ncbi:MAG TPA: hypothetical protein VNL18_16715 [Gemmatimonadales bacterium]|nr:hypothetical protein [Gemmatimonadales bacterium]
MNARALLGVTAVLSGAAAQLAGQGATCRMQLDSMGGQGRHVEVAPGQVHQFGGGGVWASCPGQQTRMYADSVAWFSERNRVDFVGRVEFRDSAVTLNADRAAYFPSDERLEAYGNVRLVNRNAGSELEGPNLTYRREVPGTRDTADLYATGRPTVRHRAAGDESDEPYVIEGEHVRLRGQDEAWAGGAVTVERSDFAALADSAELRFGAGHGAFLGHAQVTGKGDRGYVLAGRQILFRLADGRVTWVQAQGEGDATSTEWRLSADTIEFHIVADLVQGGLAWGDSIRPVALSSTYTMRADSLALDTPGQQLREIRGFGRALATARTDSAGPEPDWVGGDSLVARFDAAAEGGPRMLQTLEARGNARAFYRVYDAADGALAGINYSRGLKIVATFKASGVDRVDVIGGGDGVYLEPQRRRPP